MSAEREVMGNFYEIRGPDGVVFYVASDVMFAHDRILFPDFEVPFKIEIGPGRKPHANNDLQDSWLLIEKDLSIPTMDHLHPNARVLGIAYGGFEQVLPLLPNECVDEILLVDLLTHWDIKQKPLWKQHPMSILTRESHRVLMPNGCVTVVEKSDPAPIDRICALFLQAGFRVGNTTQLIEEYTSPLSPRAYNIKYIKPDVVD